MISAGQTPEDKEGATHCEISPTLDRGKVNWTSTRLNAMEIETSLILAVRRCKMEIMANIAIASYPNGKAAGSD